MKIGTLKELNVKPGDVVECVCDGVIFECFKYPLPPYSQHLWARATDGSERWSSDGSLEFRIVSRSSDPATPKLWRDMTPAEKGALLLARHEGKVIEFLSSECKSWSKVTCSFFTPIDHYAYRVKPGPTRETVTLRGGDFGKNGAIAWSFRHSGHIGPDTHRITFDLIDGKPDPSSIKMDAI